MFNTEGEWGNDTRFRGAHWKSRKDLNGGAARDHFLGPKKWLQIVALYDKQERERFTQR